MIFRDSGVFLLRKCVKIARCSNLFSVREFDNNCLLYTLDEVLRYADVLNFFGMEDEE